MLGSVAMRGLAQKSMCIPKGGSRGGEVIREYTVRFVILTKPVCRPMHRLQRLALLLRRKGVPDAHEGFGGIKKGESRGSQ